MPVLLNPSRFAATGPSAYDTAVLAASPWGFWKTTETSGSTLFDASPNARNMTITGSPTLAQTGPNGVKADAISWTNVASQHAETAATTNAATFTHVAWVYLTAAPASGTAIMSRATAYGSAGAADGRLFIDTAGKVQFIVYNGATQTLVSTSALTLNTWVMVVASVGAAGMKIRFNKADAVSPSVGTTFGYSSSGQIILMRGGDSILTGTGPVKIARGAYFTSQLSNATTDAFYDAV